MSPNDLVARLAGMAVLVEDHRWTDLEADARARCAEVDQGLAERIAGVDLTDWCDAVGAAARRAIPGSPDVAAVYWEFDPDNTWSSAFFGCGSYRSRPDGDDDWASDVLTTTAGPASPPLAGLYDPSFERVDRPIAGNAFLFARTYAGFGRAVAADWPRTVSLCIGFHDQDPVLRVVGR